MDVAPGADLPSCTFPKCKMQHDLAAFLKSKPPDAGPECYVFSTYGYCPRGVACRFSGHHVDAEGRNLRKEGFTIPVDQSRLSKSVQIELRKRQYDFSKAEKVCQEAWDKLNANVDTEEDKEKPMKDCGLLEKKIKLDTSVIEEQGEDVEEGNGNKQEEELTHKKPTNNGVSKLGPVDDSDLIKTRLLL